MKPRGLLLKFPGIIVQCIAALPIFQVRWSILSRNSAVVQSGRKALAVRSGINANHCFHAPEYIIIISVLFIFCKKDIYFELEK